MLFPEIKIFEADMFREYRGDIWTTYKKSTFPVDLDFIHDKFSSSRKGVIRGIHGDHKTWKLVSCLQGELYFVVVDNRQESKNYLKWDCMMLDDKDRRQVLLPTSSTSQMPSRSNYRVMTWRLWAYQRGTLAVFRLTGKTLRK